MTLDSIPVVDTTWSTLRSIDERPVREMARVLGRLGKWRRGPGRSGKCPHLPGSRPLTIPDAICVRVRRRHQSGHRVECSAHLPVHNKIIRRVVFAILLFAIVALVRVWPDKSAKAPPSFTPANKPRQLAASTSTVEAPPVMPATHPSRAAPPYRARR